MSVLYGISCILVVLASWQILPIKLQQSEMTNRTSCGPLKKRISEDDLCLESDVAVPCPNSSKLESVAIKSCRPPYKNSIDHRTPNYTYYCSESGWFPQYDGCAPDCGLSTESNKYPWLVAIYDSKDDLICAGTIISAYHVLTAGTCFHGGPVEWNARDNYTIIAGKHYVNIHKEKKSAQVRKIKDIVIDTRPYPLIPIDPQYFGHTIDYDLALLEVDKEFEFFDDVQPICLDWDNYYEETDFRDGNEAIATGWEYDKSEMVPCVDPNEFNVQYWQRSTCKENLPFNWEFKMGRFSEQKFCAAYTNEQSSCGKVRGAGLYFKSNPWRYYLKGITGIINPDVNATYIFYNKVPLFTGWLKENIGKRSEFMYSEFATTFDKEQPIREIGCRLPEHVKYGRFKLILGYTYKINTWVPSGTRIILTCVGNTTQASLTVRCSLGQWQPSIDTLECKRPGSCPALLSSQSEDISCRLNGQNVNCSDPEENTIAVARCNPFYAIAGNKPIYKCHDGDWDQPFTPCTLDCGTKRVGAATLILGGNDTIENEYPWVVAIYRLTELVCGGTAISKSYVLTAAHCVTKFKGVPESKELYTIIAGKYYRNFSIAEQAAQIRKIKTLIIHPDYKGSLVKQRDDIALLELDAELTPTLEVQPACVDWDSTYEDIDLIDDNKGVVTGWGYTREGSSPSDVLKKIVVPFRDKKVCLENLPAEFGNQYVAADKICAGYDGSDINVCSGDSGGGFYFKSPDNRYYIRGIVSLTVKSKTSGCQPNKFALYTKVSKYLPWMESITRRVL